jgi:hypothetical protein
MQSVLVVAGVVAESSPEIEKYLPPTGFDCTNIQLEWALQQLTSVHAGRVLGQAEETSDFLVSPAANRSGFSDGSAGADAGRLKAS